jgi:hypothetical protein
MVPRPPDRRASCGGRWQRNGRPGTMRLRSDSGVASGNPRPLNKQNAGDLNSVYRRVFVSNGQKWRSPSRPLSDDSISPGRYAKQGGLSYVGVDAAERRPVLNDALSYRQIRGPAHSAAAARRAFEPNRVRALSVSYRVEHSRSPAGAAFRSGPPVSLSFDIALLNHASCPAMKVPPRAISSNRTHGASALSYVLTEPIQQSERPL